MSHKKADIQINPFVFPSETEARFFLLIGITILSTLGVIYALVGGVVLKQGHLPAFVVAAGVTISVFAWALRLACQDAHERIQTRAWKTFPPSCPKDSNKEASLQRMNYYIHQIVECIPSVKALSPKFVWDDNSEGSVRPTGIAFGFGDQKFVCLRNDLHSAFVHLSRPDKPDLFHPVVLHELGHLENQDVNKTIFSIALGRSFFPIALIALFLLDIYWVWAALEKIVGNQSLEPVWEGGSVIASINLKAILLMLIVEMIRSSILRVREYYADGRARVWIGNPNAFFTLFEPSKKESSKEEQSSSQEGDNNQNFLMTLWRILVQKFHKYLAPLHPTERQRINVLLNPHQLFRPSYEVAFFAGLLSGLSINSSLLIVIASTDLWDLLKDFVDPTSQNWIVLIMGLLILAVTTLAFLICTLVPIVIFVCITIPRTVGLQIQAASLVDKTAISRERYTTVVRLVVLSLLLSLGFILGCLLSPVASPLSIVPTPDTFFLALPILPFYIGLWGGVFLLWMLPLSWIASRLYAKHIGDQIPQGKQRFLKVVSVLALLPTSVSMSFVHIILSHRILCLSPDFPDNLRWLCPESLSVWDLGFMLISVGLLSLILQGFVWVLGWLVMMGRGWFKRIHCPNCDAPIHGQITVNQTCHLCQYPLRGWIQIPPPLSLPPLPIPPVPLEDAPPL